MDPVGLPARARILYAGAQRDLATTAHQRAATVSTPAAPGSLITAVREQRRQIQHALDLSVLAERASGTSWDVIATRLGRSLADTRAMYEDLYVEWALGEYEDDPEPSVLRADQLATSIKDPNPAATALALDAWVQQHADVEHPAPEHPVSAVLA